MQRSTVTISVVSMICAIIGTAGVYTMMGAIHRERDDASVVRVKINELHEQNKQSAGLARLDKSISNLVEELDALSLNVSDEGIVAFVAEMDENARRTGVKLESSDPEVPADRSKLRMRVAVSGSWEQVHRFIAVVEHLPYLVEVSDVSVGTGDPITTPAPRSYKAQMSFTVLSVRVPQQ